MAPKTKKLIMWQPPMIAVLKALVPLALASVYYFGWRGLLMLVACNAAAFAVEWLYLREEPMPVSSAVFVTASLLALALPPPLPIWMGMLGAAFAILFGKMVFGGFGRNVFNPALTGRAFLYLCFPIFLTSQWASPQVTGAGGFVRWTTDAVSGATPLTLQRQGTVLGWQDLLLGRKTGSIGETCAVLVVLGGLYLLWKKAANWRVVVSGFLGFLGLQTALWAGGVQGVLHPAVALLSGSFLFGVFFFATDPISGAQTDEGRWFFGAFFGALTVVIRSFSAWPEGVMYAVLLANVFTPIVDHAVREWQAAAKSRKAVTA